MPSSALEEDSGFRKAIVSCIDTYLDRNRELLSVGDVVVELGTRSVMRGGEALEFTTAEFDLLETLLRAAGQVVSREGISEKTFSRHLIPLDRSIDMHICQLRKKLGPPPKGSRVAERIKTVRAVGYMYCCSSEDPGPDLNASYGPSSI